MAYEIQEKKESLTIDGKQYEANGFEEKGPGETLQFHNETFVVTLYDDTRLEYGAMSDEKATFNDYLKIKEDLIKIVQSYKKILDETANWQTYRNEEYGYEIQYPKDWAIEENSIYAFGTILLPKEFQGNKRDMKLDIQPVNWGTDSCLISNNCAMPVKDTYFSGKNAREVSSGNTDTVYCRGIHIIDIKDTKWGKYNQIGYCIRKEYKYLIPLYDQILSTFKLTP